MKKLLSVMCILLLTFVFSGAICDDEGNDDIPGEVTYSPGTPDSIEGVWEVTFVREYDSEHGWHDISLPDYDDEPDGCNCYMTMYVRFEYPTNRMFLKAMDGPVTGIFYCPTGEDPDCNYTFDGTNLQEECPGSEGPETHTVGFADNKFRIDFSHDPADPEDPPGQYALAKKVDPSVISGAVEVCDD